VELRKCPITPPRLGATRSPFIEGGRRGGEKGERGGEEGEGRKPSCCRGQSVLLQWKKQVFLRGKFLTYSNLQKWEPIFPCSVTRNEKGPSKLFMIPTTTRCNPLASAWRLVTWHPRVGAMTRAIATSTWRFTTTNKHQFGGGGLDRSKNASYGMAQNK
jgi:hypothetical protein